jgi:hypothetical protein
MTFVLLTISQNTADSILGYYSKKRGLLNNFQNVWTMRQPFSPDSIVHLSKKKTEAEFLNIIGTKVLYMDTASLRTLKIMPRNSTKLHVHEFGFWIENTKCYANRDT